MPNDQPDYQPKSTPTLPDFGEGQVTWFQSEAESVGAGLTADLINYVVPDGYELRVCSGIVSCEAPRTQRFNFITTPAGDWVSPTSHIDPDDKWHREEEAYDGDISTSAWTEVSTPGWSSYLELLVNPTYIDKVRFYTKEAYGILNTIDLDVFYGGGWVDLYEGVFNFDEWVEKDILAPARLVSKARVRFFFPAGRYAWGYVNEFMFDTSGETAQETIYFDTYALIPYLPEAPYPVPTGATFTLRVYNDDAEAQKFSINLAGFLQVKV